MYSNFVTSMDGRITIVDPDNGQHKVPPQIANPRDWRLFQELAARADLVLTSGRYLRELALGQAQDVLPVSPAAEFEDLRAWRLTQGLRPQPDVAVFSASLQFPLPTQVLPPRRMLVFTGREAPATREAELRAAGVEVIRCGDAGADATEAVAAMGRRGYSRVYSIGGPCVMAELLRADVLDSLFVTTVHRFLGGRGAAMVEGPPLESAGYHLSSLYYDPAGSEGVDQSLARYDRGAPSC